MTPFSDRVLGQHWFRQWLVTWRHQAWTNADLRSAKSNDINLRTVLEDIPQSSNTGISLKITYLKFHSNLPRVNDLTHDLSSVRSSGIYLMAIFTGNADNITHKKRLENYPFKITTTSPRGQWVKGRPATDTRLGMEKTPVDADMNWSITGNVQSWFSYTPPEQVRRRYTNQSLSFAK